MGSILTRNRRSETYPELLRSMLMIRSRSICIICNIQYVTMIILNEHMQRDHANASYTCDRCDLICETWSTFQEHVHTFHRDMVFCSYCYKAFSNYLNLVQHWKTHGKNRYLCSGICTIFTDRTI